jgi:hypothetical protein
MKTPKVDPFGVFVFALGNCVLELSRSGSPEPLSVLASVLARDHTVQDFASDIGQSEISTVVRVSQFLVVDPKQVQDCCVQIVQVLAIDSGFVSNFVRLSVGDATSCAASREPSGEAMWIVVATRFAAELSDR